MKLILLTLFFILFALTNNFSQCSFENDIESCSMGNLNVTSGICGNLIFQMTSAPIAPIPMCDGGGVLNNPSYYAFVADGTSFFSVTVTPVPGTCTNAGGFFGIQGALVAEDGCNTFNSIGDCFTACTTNSFNLTSYSIPNSGQIMIVVLDGCNGSVCNVELNINSGWTNNPTVPDTSIINQSNIELESNVNCTTKTFTVHPEFEGLCNYLWTLPDGSTRTTNTNSLIIDMNGIPDGSVCVKGFSEDCFPGQFFPEDNSICYSFTDSEFATVSIGGEATTCGLANGLAFVEVEGEGPFNYLWNNGIADSRNTNIEGGLYTVTVTDSYGCEYIESITIAESEGLVIEVVEILPSSATENTGSISIEISDGDEFTYELLGPQGLIEMDTISDTNINFTDLAPGVYLLNVYDLVTGCFDLIQFEIQVITSTRENQSARNKTIKLFPNPVSNILNVEMENAGNDYTIFSLDGKVIQTGALNNKQILIENLNSGVYILQIEDSAGLLHYAKLLKVN